MLSIKYALCQLKKQIFFKMILTGIFCVTFNLRCRYDSGKTLVIRFFLSY